MGMVDKEVLLERAERGLYSYVVGMSCMACCGELLWVMTAGVVIEMLLTLRSTCEICHCCAGGVGT
jgi:hypothetical protein